jgi:hypothetical protein
MQYQSFFLRSALVLITTLAACGGDGGAIENEQEIITTVILTFTPQAGGAPIVAVADDPDGDGGNPETVDPITLPAGIYNLVVAYENRLETPAENITAEIADEATEHQVFFTGPAPGTFLTHGYADMDDNGLPIGLANVVQPTGPGVGTLVVTLRHLPPINDVPTKTATLAAEVQAGGLGAIGGDTDRQATFQVTVP